MNNASLDGVNHVDGKCFQGVLEQGNTAAIKLVSAQVSAGVVNISKLWAIQKDSTLIRYARKSACVSICR